MVGIRNAKHAFGKRVDGDVGQETRDLTNN